MHLNGAYFAGIVAGMLILVGFNFIRRRQGAVGFGLWIGVLLLTVLAGYVSFSL